MDSNYQGTRSSSVADLPHLSDDELLAALEAGTLPEARFDHAAHVRAAYLYLRRLPFPQAVATMCTTIRNYARALGKSERYHETITIAFMSLIHGQIWRQAEGAGWEEFRARNPQLLRSDALLAYYPKAVLESPEARARFLLMPLAGEPQQAGRCT